LTCYVRLMGKGDISQVTAIDHEAFPTLWPPPNYRRELDNRLARYLVACDDTLEALQSEVAPVKGSWLKRLFEREVPPTTREYILGFAGFWIVAGEVHITNIAVRESLRRQGIGELLLISLINLAIKLEAQLITLEVRASNTVAQALYAKYGFAKVGVRRAYYTDNREDGVLMTLEDINSTPVQARLKRLKEDHLKRWGIAAYSPD
jgi:ribosomal-protein-alanine N-acetyltransferase